MQIKIIFLLLINKFALSAQVIPAGFVNLNKEIPNLVVDLRYASSENFTGRVVPGYNSSKAIGTEDLATALKKVQAQLKPYGLGLKLFDAYRPQIAVNTFIIWADYSSDTLKKEEYYPDLKKNSLFELGYIAEKSAHTKGSTVDITLIYLEGINKGKEVDMGGKWDYFSKKSNFTFQGITSKQYQNRELLRNLMESEAFLPYDKEWWHFTLKDEPFPKTYFDFMIP
ncbi:MAG: M15 family metallopeptidase [Flavobacteriales bacterium]